MKTKLLKFVIGAVVACSFSAVADEQGYLSGTNTLTLAEGESLIVLCIINSSSSYGDIDIEVELPPYNEQPEPNIYNLRIIGDTDLASRTILGPCKIKNQHQYHIFGYKISSAEPFANPMNIVTLPADNDGDVDLLVETSSDLQTWSPVYSGSVGTSNTASFIRTRLIQN